jgi:hypothetical protein
MTDPRCWNDLATENAALKAENARLREALTKAASIVADDVRELGPCDHNVGICICELRRDLDEIRAALAHGQALYDPEK